eukprot:SAG11_NODE_6302_length_1342_cov_1.155270_4_plen_179_part_00
MEVSGNCWRVVEQRHPTTRMVRGKLHDATRQALRFETDLRDSDLRTVEKAEVKRFWAMAVKKRVDYVMFSGGTPCTDLSSAKRCRHGLRGSRSEIFFNAVQILGWLEEIREKHIREKLGGCVDAYCPQLLCFFENVGSMKPADRAVMEAEVGLEARFFDASLYSSCSRSVSRANRPRG